MSLTPARAALIGRIGAAVTRQRYGGHEQTAKARKALDEKWYAGLDDYPPADRERIARARRDEHFARLSLAGVEARQRKAGKR